MSFCRKARLPAAFYSLAIHVQPYMVLLKGLPLNFVFIFCFNSSVCLSICIQYCFAWLGDAGHFSIVLLMLYPYKFENIASLLTSLTNALLFLYFWIPSGLRRHIMPSSLLHKKIYSARVAFGKCLQCWWSLNLDLKIYSWGLLHKQSDFVNNGSM